MRVRAKLLEAVMDWFKRYNYTEVQTPILVPLSQGSQFSSFEVHYFGERVHLAQGACPYLEALMACLGKVYAIAPAFRAERQPTKRHLTEFWRVECLAPEFYLQDMMKVQEKLITSVCRHLSNEASEELQVLDRDLSNVNPPFPRISYDEAIETLQGDEINVFWGQEVEAEQEEHLSKKFDKPFFVYHHPLGAQTFFYKSHPQKTELALVADLLAPDGYGEIATCGQMIDDTEELLQKLKTEKIDEKNYQWHLDLERSISYPRSGFAVGIERLLMWMCGLARIDETTVFPRPLQSDPSSCFLKNVLTCSR